MRAASSASSLEPKKKPASAVTTIRNGNSAIKVDSAMWLAIAQPSSARKCRKASATIRSDSLTVRKRWAPARYRSLFEIGYRWALCKGWFFTSPRTERRTSGRLHVGEELAYFRFQVLRLGGDGVGQVLDVGGG